MRVSKIAPLDQSTPVTEEVRARHTFLSEHFKELSDSQWGWVYAQHGGEKMSEQVPRVHTCADAAHCVHTPTRVIPSRS